MYNKSINERSKEYKKAAELSGELAVSL